MIIYLVYSNDHRTAEMSVIRIYFLVRRTFMLIARFPQSLYQDKSILHDIRSRGRRDSSMSIVTRWRTGKYRCHGSIASRVKRFISLLQRPDRVWDPTSLLFNEYQGCFSWGNWSGCKAEYPLSSGPRVYRKGTKPPVLPVTSWCKETTNLSFILPKIIMMWEYYSHVDNKLQP
jgi:hypothetical protein